MHLEARDVSVNYGQRCVVREVSLSCSSGTMLGVLGPNGAGKTSLLKALGGLSNSTGQISYGGAALSSLSSTERARTVTYVPQRSLLDARLSVTEVVEQGRYCHRGGWAGAPSTKDRAAVAEALEKVDIQSLAHRSFRKLSGGEQRRVLLARALATEARVILLDEPTASLDIAHALTLFDTLRRLADDGCSIVCVLHDLADARRSCDQVVVLKNGIAEAQGSSRQVLQSDTVRRVYGVELIEDAGLAYALPQRVSPREVSGAKPPLRGEAKHSLLEDSLPGDET